MGESKGISAMNNDMSFGEFIIAKRKEKDLSARQLAIKLDISPVYMCDIEKGRKNAFSDELLEKMRVILCVTEQDCDTFYDLAAVARNTVSSDLPEYIMENELVRTALRKAKKNQIPDEKWEKFIEEMVRKPD